MGSPPGLAMAQLPMDRLSTSEGLVAGIPVAATSLLFSGQDLSLLGPEHGSIVSMQGKGLCNPRWPQMVYLPEKVGSQIPEEIP